MTHNQSETPEQTSVSATWWTPRRTKVASLCGLVGGLGGLGVAGLLIGNSGPGFEPGASSLLYPAWHVLLAIPVLAAATRYSYGQRGRSVAVLLALSLVGYAGITTVFLGVSLSTIGDRLYPMGILSGTTYLAIRLLGSLYGVSLWRRASSQTSTSRLTASLFIVLLPAIFVLGMLTQIGFPGWLINTPLYLAVIALSYDLWTLDADASIHEIRGSAS